MSAVSNPESFWYEARAQMCCAECGSTGEFDAHHAVERQELRRRGLPEWDTRCALRLCPLTGGCHGGQTSKLHKIQLTNLTDDNVAYAFEALGAAAYYYLRRHYAGYDPRVEALAEGAFP